MAEIITMSTKRMISCLEHQTCLIKQGHVQEDAVLSSIAEGTHTGYARDLGFENEHRR